MTSDEAVTMLLEAKVAYADANFTLQEARAFRQEACWKANRLAEVPMHRIADVMGLSKTSIQRLIEGYEEELAKKEAEADD